MQDIQNQIFSDFEPPCTTDGSHLGVMHHVKETQKHYDMKFEQELLKVNHRLKSSKTKVSLQAKKGGIQLRATLPLKPNDTHKQGRDKKQYTISLGIPASFDGLKTAEEEGYELGKLIARQTFTWTDKYLGKQAQRKNNITFDEFYEQFEKRYFETRKRTIKSENTFNTQLRNLRYYFSGKEVITIANLREKIKIIDSSVNRMSAISLANILCKMLNIEANFSDLKVSYKPKKRNIPNDEQISNSISLFKNHYLSISKMSPSYRDNWRIYQTIYALLAIYGLRPREIVNNPNLDWLMSHENKHNTFKVHESNKTGYREVFPFVAEWIEIFDLKNIENIEKLKKFSSSWKTASQLKDRVATIANNFRYAQVKFTPYDLRHACAIRAHLQGIPIKAAANNLGHSVQMHTKVYQQWFSLENTRKAFEHTFEEVNEVGVLKDENARLKKRIAELEHQLAKQNLSEIMKT
ncbi:phage integrase family protein [Rivularia sp. PCC 7116]|uniref:site-specific integrase n=1 Tax=Rivularia sp. PCC 7116 TaxID=373994 RepID=UPI00029F4D66|nr:site-specific integrase [Rivularia sp. PCC 7116]AFY58703.1 phage integrase family protein [Rivularia sp. PCC 7116]